MSLNNDYKTKLRNLRYLNRGIVFALDLLLASVGVFLSLMIMSFLLKKDVYGSLAAIMIVAVALSAGLFLITGSYKTSIRFSTLRELSKIFCILAVKAFVMSLVIVVLKVIDGQYIVFYAILDMSITSFLMISSRSFMVSVYYSIVSTAEDSEAAGNNALIYGARGNAPMLAAQINDDLRTPYRVIGFLSCDDKKEVLRISGQRVYGWNGELPALESIVARRNISHILFTNIADFNHERDRLVDFCIEHNIQMLIGGEVQLLDNNKSIRNHIKPIDIEDLLYREEIQMDIEAVSHQMSGKVILVTGAAGSIGREIASQLAHLDVRLSLIHL